MTQAARGLPLLPCAAAALVAGTAAAATAGGPPALTAAFVALAVAAVSALLAPEHWWVAALIAAAVAGAGHLRYEELRAASPPPLAAVRGEHSLIAMARDDAVVSGVMARVDMTVEELDGRPVGGGLRLRLRAPRRPIRAGERLSLTVKIEPPPEVDGFDYAGYLRSRGIHAVGAFPRQWERIGQSDEGPRAALRGLRRWATANIERSLPDPAAALAVGVLLGERRSMPDEIVEELRLTGTTHLVVVSGQNVALLLGSAVSVLTLAVPKRRAAIVALLLLPPYVLLIGGDPPVTRAAIMAAGLAVSSVTGRRTPGWIYLVEAAALMLLIDPALIDDVAFQLSATATAGVMIVAPALQEMLLRRAPELAGGPGGTIVEVATMATGATIAVVPVQVAAFERISLAAIPANVAVAPLYEGTVLVALLAGLFGWLPPVVQILAVGGRAVPDAFLGLVSVFARLPAAELVVTAPLAAGVLWYAGLTGILAWWGRRPAATRGGAGGGIERSVGLAVIAGGLWTAALAPQHDLIRIVVLDVGQGTAVLVEERGTRVLIDTSTPDGIVIRALSRAGVIGSLDAVIVSHADADHAGGIRHVLARMDVGSLLSDPGTLAAIDERGIEIDIGDRLHLSHRTTIDVLGPPLATGPPDLDANERSLVLMVTAGSRRVLVPGDAGAPAEGWLVHSGQPLRADALVMPHHGSSGSSTPEFVAAVRPAVAIASAGADNRFGHPAPEVIERYAPALVYRTDRDGDITIWSDGTRMWVESGAR